MFSVDQLAAIVSGRVAGDGSREISGAAPLESAGPDDLTYVVNESYGRRLRRSRAGAAVVPETLELHDEAKSLIRVAHPQAAFARLVQLFYPQRHPNPGVHPTATLGRGVRLGADVTVEAGAIVGEGSTVGDRSWLGAGCYVGTEVRIGPDCRLDPGSSVLEGSLLGSRVHLHAGARVGVEGFGYAAGGEGTVKIPQVGRCVIGDGVEIGANATIDRGSLGDTVVGERTKIDNLVHIGHNCRIGADCFIAAQVGLAGSTVVGDGVQIGGQAGLAGHLTVGDGARIGAQAGVVGSVPREETWTGYPARPHWMWLRSSSVFYKLPGLARRLVALERRLAGKTEE